ncbi:MAG: hypothetical protein CMP93_06340 [Gammaproteobacteria bacterium]|nr:hypothetical protein [Gammaproteobacteria bacterium]|tara:strand:+ start:2023 stop:2748 length:726 start_codon:yes stop_codon:yes gene_type:complete
MAQKYFKHFPTIDFDVKNDGNLIQAKDIFRNIRVSSDAEDAIIGYEYYYINDQDRPDVLASKLYGDATLYWLFWMVNDQFATYNDWPKSQSILDKFINRKYSGKALVANQQSDIVSSSDSKFLQGEKVVGSTSSALGFVTKIDPTNKQVILNDVQGVFQDGETVTGSQSTKSFIISSVRNFSDSPHHYVNSDGNKTTSETTTMVTNRDYEQTFNDSKRSIKYIKTSMIPQLLREFKSMIRE